jgi:beta-1,4-mannosyl-glycoprotein beta-1,4-N-acetylglucosaminyltransferase
MTVYDCTLFLNENDLYEIRLKSHWDFIDKFIVIEAEETHTGLRKPLKFDQKRFEKYSSKIVYVTFDNFDDTMAKHPELVDEVVKRDRGPHFATKDWSRDRFQFNYLVKVLTDLGAQDDDIVYFSCLDEILKKDAFEFCLPAFQDKSSLYEYDIRPIFFFNMNLYGYKFNLLHKPWQEHISSSITQFQTFKKFLPATIRENGITTHPVVRDAGWHFTFLDPTDGELVLEKQRSWAHSRDIRPGEKVKFENSTKEEAVKKFFEDYKPVLVTVTRETHPPYIVDNLEKFQNFIYKV